MGIVSEAYCMCAIDSFVRATILASVDDIIKIMGKEVQTKIGGQTLCNLKLMDEFSAHGALDVEES